MLNESEEVSEDVIQEHVKGLKNKKAADILRVTVEQVRLASSQEMTIIPNTPQPLSTRPSLN